MGRLDVFEKMFERDTVPRHKTFYTADLHLGSSSLVRYDVLNGAPEGFSDASERDAAILERWNAKVRLEDEVYILGDIFEFAEDDAFPLMSALNGTKHLILGNHDGQWLHRLMFDPACKVVEIASYLEIEDNGRKAVLSHYPMPFWNGQHEGWWHLYGHLHASSEETAFQEFGMELVEQQKIPEFRAFNVGTMLHGYEPVTLDELTEQNDGVGSASKKDFERVNERMLVVLGRAS